MKKISIVALVLGAAAAWGVLSAQEKAGEAKLRTFESPYYIIHTDLPDEPTREAYIRMTCMYEEYKRRTSGFSGDIKGKFPFFLYKNREDYVAAGGPPDSAGVFMRGMGGAKLMAIAGEKTNASTWHVVQHEGFHQFAAAVIRGDLPPWLNEGLADYFGESLFTGDSFVSGVIPGDRLRRIKLQIEEKRFKPFKEMMVLTQEEWNGKLSMANYDQGWAMVYFLAHGEDGKYQKAFVRFMTLIGQGRPYMDAWTEVFGRDDAAFQKRFEKWWTELPKDTTKTLYERATLLTLTSFYARAVAQGQTFDSEKDFLNAAAEGGLKITYDDYLPATLLKSVMKSAKGLEDFKIVPGEKNKMAQLSCTLSDGTTLLTTYALAGKKVRAVEWKIKPVAAGGEGGAGSATRPGNARK